MAVYTLFARTEYANAANSAATGLTGLGVFDTVSVSNGTITCTLNGSTVATFGLADGRVDTVFGNYTNSVNSGMNFWIGYNTNGVFINGYIASYGMFTYSVYKSKSGKPMFTYHAIAGNAIGFVHVALDTESPTLSSNLSLSSGYFSTMQIPCAAPGVAETVSVGDNVGTFVFKQSNVSDQALSVVSIGGQNYFTDGYLCFKE
jgi:hypothetical protein